MLYGTAWKKEETKSHVINALTAGFRGVDTACQPKHYNEEGVGEALAFMQAHGVNRTDIYLQTKFTPLDGQDPNRIPYDKTASLTTQVAQSFARSKVNLQTEYIDAYILHSPLFPFSKLLEVWRAMEALYIQGEIKALGISNCYEQATLERLYKEATIKPSILQNRFYADTDYDVSLRLWCREYQIKYQSFWSLTANPHIIGSKLLLTLSKKYQLAPEQIFYAYLMSQGITPLNGTTSIKHMQDDLKSATVNLTVQEIKDISVLLS